MRKILIIGLILFFSCNTKVKEDSDEANRDSIEIIQSDERDDIICANFNVDKVFNDWKRYQCNLYHLFDEECYESIDVLKGQKRVRLFIRNFLDENYIYSYTSNESCTIFKSKVIPPTQFNLFTYLTQDSDIEYFAKRQIVSNINFSKLINDIDLAFNDDLPEIQENVLYVLEVLAPKYKVYYAADSLTEEQKEVVLLLIKE